MYQNQVIMCTQKVANFWKKLRNTPNKKLWNGKKLIFQLVALAQMCEFSIGLRDWEWPTCIHIFYHISRIANDDHVFSPIGMKWGNLTEDLP
jgi:hypothetical protein